jgi:hypothetical protein
VAEALKAEAYIILLGQLQGGLSEDKRAKILRADLRKYV